MMFGTYKVKKQEYIEKIEDMFNLHNDRIKFQDSLILNSEHFENVSSGDSTYLTMDNNIVDIFKSLKDGSEKAFNLFYFKTLTFLFTIARNIALNYIKSKKEDLEYDDGLNYASDTKEQKIDVNIIFAVLLNEIKVKEEDCDILLLHIIQGYAFNEIAAMYNANLNTIITKYNRIIKKLQNYFAEKGGSLDAI